MTLEVLTWLRGYQTDEAISRHLDRVISIKQNKSSTLPSRRYTHKESILAAKRLELECPLAGEYLAWLLRHKVSGMWPGAKGNGLEEATREELELETAQ